MNQDELKIDKLRIYIFESILLIILFLALFVPNIFTRGNVAIILVIGTIIASLLIQKRKVKSIESSNVSKIMLLMGIIYLMAFYGMGIYFGFYKSSTPFGKTTIMNYIIPITTIIISSEILRNILIVQNTKFAKTITFIMMMVIDTIIYYNIYDINTYDKMLEIIGFALFGSISCNLLYNYVSSRYGIIGNMIYRLITVLYAYVLPYIPNMYVFFRSILRMIYPYIIFQVIEYIYGKRKQTVKKTSERTKIIMNAIAVILIILLAMFISCQFTFGILVIGSESMTGTCNKGDAIVFRKYERGKQQAEVGQVIVFNKNNTKIIHRVIEIKKVNDEVRYTTKGDANQKKDDGYITDENIMGISLFRIQYIGFASIWIRDIFSK